MQGKKRRLKRIMKNGRAIIIPMDHGMTKPENGLEDVDRIMAMLDGIADAFILHKGMAKNSSMVEELESALIIHLSASTYLSPDPLDKRVITSVEKAIQLGADAVSVHVNIGCERDIEQIREASLISEKCDDYGIPLLVMAYPRGVGINEFGADEIKLAVRVANEIGADIVKTNYTGDAESFKDVLKFSKAPVVIAGGSKTDETSLLKTIEEAISAGAGGVAIGRNVFQSRNPRNLVLKISEIVHGVIYERGMVNR
ncbi:fructose-bisphosphate aldolase [Geoglobus acetivorans]|uniref:2-amino-3,7-dideoxy-D-threo-hept-6-ulosonate synthase n=2 Tax=Geoglobus acetivorans TaxID=565033 RepID=A0ABZ3H6C1_GEOAI|nr:fructose-bisphosphate aldolase [Geoglobus acetivorans]